MKKSETKSERNEKLAGKTTTRRKIIKRTVTVGALAGTASQLNAGKWIKPVIDSTVLPIHADTTCLGLECMNDVERLDPGFSRFGHGGLLELEATICPPISDVVVTLALVGSSIINATDITTYLSSPRYRSIVL